MLELGAAIGRLRIRAGLINPLQYECMSLVGWQFGGAWCFLANICDPTWQNQSHVAPGEWVIGVTTQWLKCTSLRVNNVVIDNNNS
jgi:hypothetical protein